MVAAIATMASSALPPSASTARPSSTAAKCGAQTTPRLCPALCRSMMVNPLPAHSRASGNPDRLSGYCTEFTGSPLPRGRAEEKSRLSRDRLRGRLGKAALAQERVGARQAAAKRLVGLGRIAGAAGRIDEIVQPLRRLRIEHVAGLFERFEGIGVEHFRPHVAVVAGRIA